MDEASFWSDRLRPALVRECQKLKKRHTFERVENLVNDGTPDVDYCIDGVAGKLELKYSPTHPGDTAQVLKGKGLRRSQIIYASRYAWAGGRIWCCIGTPEATWLIDLRGLAPPELAALAVATPDRLNEIAAWRSNHRAGRTLPLALIDAPA